MKKIALSASFLILSFAVRSQLLDIRAYGGIGVVNVADPNSVSTINGLKYDNTTEVSSVIQVGVSSTIGRRVFIQPGIFWQSGTVSTTKTETFGTKKTFEDQTKLSMITVPIKIGIRLLKYDKLTRTNVRLFGGIDAQFLTAVDQTKESGLVTVKTEDFAKWTTYGDVGVGVDFLFMFADLGYRLAFNTLYQTGDQSRANIIYVNAGFKIKL
ncbi:MAG: hypothetical protein PSX36_02130 [bacterium]|nr:hypothetical protein [bacterium]